MLTSSLEKTYISYSLLLTSTIRTVSNHLIVYSEKKPYPWHLQAK